MASDVDRVGQQLDQAITTNKNILSIFLQDNVANRDVLEFVFTIQKNGSSLKGSQKLFHQIRDEVQVTLSFRIFARSLEKCDSMLDEYLKTLTDLQVRNQLDRTLANALLRRKLEQLNSGAAVEASLVEEKLRYLVKEQKLERLTQRASIGVASSDVKSPIEDPEGRDMWEASLGNSVGLCRIDIHPESRR